MFSQKVINIRADVEANKNQADSSIDLSQSTLKPNASKSDWEPKNKLYFHKEEPELLARVELFKKYSQPFIVPGREDLGSFLYFGGLGATNYSWRDFAMKLAIRTGINTEAYSLGGHTGEWSDMKATTEEGWIRAMESVTAKRENKPVVFCYSTAALVAMELERRNPGSFAAIVAVGAPLFLKKKRLELYLDLGLAAEKLSEKSKLLSAMISKASVGFQLIDQAEPTKIKRKSPVADMVPVSSVLSMRRLQYMAREAVSHIQCPIYYAQGKLDPAVSRKVPEFVDRRAPSAYKTIDLFEHSAHGPQLGIERKKMLKNVISFLDNIMSMQVENKSY